jgi:hypothetical protein
MCAVKEAGMKKIGLGLFVVLLAGCASFGRYDADMPDLFIGKIQLHLVNYEWRNGTYTKGVYGSVKNMATGAVSTFGIESDGFFARYDLEAGTYRFMGLYVDQLVIPNTRNFHMSLPAYEFTIEKNCVNVFGDMSVTLDQTAKGSVLLNPREDIMKALFMEKVPDSPWLGKPWRSVFPGAPSARPAAPPAETRSPSSRGTRAG